MFSAFHAGRDLATRYLSQVFRLDRVVYGCEWISYNQTRANTREIGAALGRQRVGARTLVVINRESR
jgi:hypothetical protein